MSMLDCTQLIRKDSQRSRFISDETFFSRNEVPDKEEEFEECKGPTYAQTRDFVCPALQLGIPMADEESLAD